MDIPLRRRFRINPRARRVPGAALGLPGFRLLPLLLLLAILPISAEVLTSPGRLVQVDVQGSRLEIRYRGALVATAIADGPRLDAAAPPPSTDSENTPAKPRYFRRNFRETWRPVLGKSASVDNHYRQLTVRGADRELVVRAYDDGVGFRYALLGSGSAKILSEQTSFQLEPGVSWPLYREQFHTSHEGPYVRATDLLPDTLIDLPLLHQGRAAAAITEAALRNYPSAYLRRDGGRLQIVLPPRMDDPNIAARVELPFATPWRVVMLAGEPGKLTESNLVANLNEPSRIADTSWIQPGKTTWSWWNGLAGEPVSPPAAFDFETMRRYIDFCARYRIRSHSIVSHPDDYPWYWQTQQGFSPGPDTDVTRPRPEIDLPRLAAYARQRNVRLRAWVHWRALDRRLDAAFAQYEKWGIEGLMIDFLDRDDQEMVNWMETTLEKAARHHLMIQFHGVFRPTGLSRTWPNLMNHEGVLNLEYSKWSDLCTPEHNVTVAYTRMLAGPLDYHLGGFRNVAASAFEARGIAPQVMGTRAHSLAMYVVYENPMPMVADYPSAYESQPGAEFISEVPETWDETRFAAGEPGEWIVMARRRGKRWYVAGMTAAAPRGVTIPLQPFGKRKWSARIWADSAETRQDATAMDVRDVQIETLQVSMAPGGGFVARLE